MHRKTHGCMSFVEMSKIMSSAWKAIDDINKAVFEELAVQGRIIHAAKLAEYEKYNVQGLTAGSFHGDRK